ncbi:unnamed protein product [Spirodela intermedia]|uniref:DUF676 domain-containing protein n=2 Tax=Spirodela intermedia TaxID=51605 RepID=A0A7I8JLT8_SPIIN|nr:unnamed protein product [Spirodela intermedia]CAA6671104.1 unnamed protein product [Spirodela intermedia]CAA7408213.1 unnamed protein product [Spirodela intermedia]
MVRGPDLAEDWRYASEQFVKKLPGKQCIAIKGNYNLTFDGVDMMGGRLSKERRPGLQRISFVAHSLGGLIARYVIDRLYEQTSRRWAAGLEPISFITFATRHLGSRGYK